jgi:hypothetical protein
MWWCILVIPALRRLRQEDCEFEDSLGYNRDPVSNNNKNPQKQKKKETALLSFKVILFSIPVSNE